MWSLIISADQIINPEYCLVAASTSLHRGIVVPSKLLLTCEHTAVMEIHTFLSLTIRIFFVLVTTNKVESGKLLVIPQEGSHWLSMRGLLDKLSHRGHKIVVVVPEPNLFYKDLGFPVQTYNLPFSKEFMEAQVKQMSKEVFEYKTVPQKLKIFYERVTNSANWLLSSCKLLLQNETLIKFLEEANIDVLLSDPAAPCGQIVAEYLSIPSVHFMRGTPFVMDQEAAQSPSPLSYIPRLFTAYTDHMNFSQRVKNVLVQLLEYPLCHLLYSHYAQVASEFLKKDVTSVDLFNRASLWLLRYDFVFEYPKPVMPNMVFIGGINCVNRKPLNQVDFYYMTYLSVISRVYLGEKPRLLAHTLDGKQQHV